MTVFSERLNLVMVASCLEHMAPDVLEAFERMGSTGETPRYLHASILRDHGMITPEVFFGGEPCLWSITYQGRELLQRLQERRAANA